MVQGRFDRLASDTIALLRRARELGDHLTVALQGRDDTLPERRACLEALRHVDAVIDADTPEALLQAIRAQQVSVVVTSSPETRAFLRDRGVEVVPLPE